MGDEKVGQAPNRRQAAPAAPNQKPTSESGAWWGMKWGKQKPHQNTGQYGIIAKCGAKGASCRHIFLISDPLFLCTRKEFRIHAPHAPLFREVP